MNQLKEQADKLIAHAMEPLYSGDTKEKEALVAIAIYLKILVERLEE